MNKKTKPIWVRFNKSEFGKIELAKKYTVIKNTSEFIRSCVNMGIKNVDVNEQIAMFFSLNLEVDKQIAYSTQVIFDEECYGKLEEIFKCVPMTPSNVIKYFMMPEVEKIIENKGWK